LSRYQELDAILNERKHDFSIDCLQSVNRCTVERVNLSIIKLNILRLALRQKEAFFKALGTGWSHKLQWKDVEVVNNSDGKPDIIVHGEALAVLKKRKITNIQVSISHEPEYACGMVILE
jgi:phosphopantethiene--protein transferase domain